ncbi:MAG TPA: hydrogenase nickel incorporation protein HypB [Candidatus Bathyarchaeia archaeon]|nr:hydrogenase nickel incorporation protein HypB [Candidatus Bathyarchaeia archaeon]
MCTSCGCADGASHSLIDLSGHAHAPHAHDHPHDRDQAHDGHEHAHHEHAGNTARPSRILRLEQDVLAKNDRLAERNRGWLEERGALCINLVSAPGAGKTTLLERTIRDLGDELPIAVIEGDQATERDAERIRAAGGRVVQITTGTGCHLDAEMVAQALGALAPAAGAVVMIENVGNLVCPALFDLGEHAKVVVASVTEGEDKPLKYPHVFRAARLMLLNKVDLLPHLSFDVDRCVSYARRVNPELRIVALSATRGDGLDTWYAWLRDELRARAQGDEGREGRP